MGVGFWIAIIWHLDQRWYACDSDFLRLWIETLCKLRHDFERWSMSRSRRYICSSSGRRVKVGSISSHRVSVSAAIHDGNCQCILSLIFPVVFISSTGFVWSVPLLKLGYMMWSLRRISCWLKNNQFWCFLSGLVYSIVSGSCWRQISASQVYASQLLTCSVSVSDHIVYDSWFSVEFREQFMNTPDACKLPLRQGWASKNLASILMFYRWINWLNEYRSAEYIAWYC